MQEAGSGIWIIDDRFLGPQLAYYLLTIGYRVGYSHSLKAVLDALEEGEVDELRVQTEVLETETSRSFVYTMWEDDSLERERLRLVRNTDNVHRLSLEDIYLVIFHTGTDPLREVEKEGLSIEERVKWNHEGADSVVSRIREVSDKVCVAYSALNYNTDYIRDVIQWGFNGVWDVRDVVDDLNRGRIRGEDLANYVQVTLEAANGGKFIEIRSGRKGGIETIYHTFSERRIRREIW